MNQNNISDINQINQTNLVTLTENLTEEKTVQTFTYNKTKNNTTITHTNQSDNTTHTKQLDQLTTNLSNQLSDDALLVKILNRYGGEMDYEEIISVIVEDYDYLDESMNYANMCYIYSLKNIILIITNIILSDRLFTRQVTPTYKSEQSFKQDEVQSPAYLDMIFIKQYINNNYKIKITHKESCKLLTVTKFITIMMKLLIIYSDQDSRLLTHILDEYTNIYDGLEDIIQLILEYNRVDILKSMIDKFTEREIDSKQFILENATNLALIALNQNSMLSYIYLSLIASDQINYKVLLHSRLNLLPKKYTYTIDINKNIEFIKDRFISDYDISYHDVLLTIDNII